MLQFSYFFAASGRNYKSFNINDYFYNNVHTKKTVKKNIITTHRIKMMADEFYYIEVPALVCAYVCGVRLCRCINIIKYARACTL